MAYNKSQKLQDNIAAIKLVLQLSKEGRTANDDERAVLRRYSGFGGLKFILNPAASDEDKRHWKISDQQYFRPVRELYAIIHEYASDDNEERAIVDSVKRSVNTAFYTPGAVIDAIASVFKERGVEVRTMLDPSAGIGKFGDSFKQAFFGDIKVSAFEKDVLTGKILSALNPNDQVTVDGFETIPAKMQGSFDLATSNIPFGDIRVMDDEYRRSKNDAKRYSVSTIHNYFFLKALDQVREGGFVAFITSRGFMDSPSNNPIRQEIAKNARLVGAFRLPDGMFRDEAGTDVGSDLVVLQKVSGYDMSLDPETQAFCETSKGFKAMSGEDYTDITMNTFWWQSMMTPDAEVSVSTNMMRGTDPYGKPTLVFTHDGGMDGISKQLKEYFSRDLHREYIDYYQEHAPKIEAAVVEQQPQGRPQGRSRGQAQQQAQSAPVQLDLFAMWDELDAGNGPSQEEVQAQEAERAAQEAARREAERKRLEPRAWVGDYKEWYRDGTVVVEPNTHHVGVLTGNTFTPLANLTADQTGRLRQYVLIRDAYHELYNTEAELREEQPDLREVLNRHYDNFFLQYGCLNERRNARVIMMDALGRDGLTLENEGEHRDFVKADIFERPVSFISYEITHVDTPEEALSASLNRYGRVNLEYMAGLTGNKQEEMPGLLKGQIYYMPDGSYEIASKALSGNVYEKLAYVSEALDMIKGQEPGADIDASIIPALEETKAALTAVIPEQIAFDDIGLQFGERWIPTEYYEEYIGKLFNTKMEIHYAEHIDEYSLKAEDRWNLKIREEFCVRGEYKDYDGMALLAHAFHNTTPDIQKCVGYDENGDDLKGPDMEKIQLANTKIEEIRDGFTEYLTNLPKEKRDELQEMYNRKFNCFVKAKYDGSYQTFPGIDLKALASPKFNIKNIYKSQKDCVKMILENGGGICDHEVGTGKSLIMCMAAHEMHRLGIANKPMIIAMKANVAEIAATYQAAFPDDKILYASEKDFSPANRVQFFSRIKNNDYACVIMSHDQFGKIPQAMEVQQQILQDEIRDIDEALDVIRQQGGNISGRMLTGLEKRKENMEVKLMELQSDMANRKDDFVDFGRMGIDHIFIDESHQFKNLMFTTRHQRVSGLGNPSGSQKALNLLYAIRTIQNRTGKDLGATFLSGTTISNSLTELYLLFKYLRPEAMAKQGIHSFDAWAAVYAKKTSDYEFSVTNAVVQKERFRYFVKVPELATFYNEITDYRTGEDVGLDRPNMNVILHDIEPTADQKDFNERLVQFAQTGDGELIFRAPLNDREMKGKMLIATDASRKASMDMRLVSQELFGDDPNNKASHCARLVSEYYQKFNEQKGTQFIFSDLSTYKPNEWNIFQEIKDKLVNDYGIPASEIRFIQEASSNKVKQKMIDLMNEGKIRVLFGSTSTLGTGVNAQQRAVAVHHIDIPWRPSDLEQRNGRARRTGNWVAKEFAGNNVDIIIYAVKRTLDSYKFNLLQNKQLFITQLKTNQLGTRVIDEGAMDEENGMNFAEYVAILSGNDDLLQKAKLEKKIMALESERKTYMQARRDTEWRLENAREKLGKNEVIINGMTEDYERYQSQVKQGEDGAPLPGLVLNNISEFTADGAYNIEEMGAALQDAGRTVGNKDRQMGTVYGFPLMVDTIYMYDEKLRKEVYAGNKFYVKGNYLYEHNNGKLAMSKDNRLGAVRYGVNALEKIPGVIAQYQERNEKLRADIAEYERIAGKPWGKEDELKGLKKEMEALDAKIRESLDETTKSMPKVEEKPYKFSKEGKWHKVVFPRDAYPFVSISEMREFADTGSWRNRGYVRCGNWDGDVMVSEPEVEGEFTLRQKAEEFIAKVEDTNNERKNNLDWLIVKAKENTKGDKVHQDNEVIFAAREALQKQGVDWQNAQEPAKGAVPTQEELEIERLLTLANTKDAHTLPLSDDLWHRARLMLDDRGIDWRTGLPINDVSKYVLKWRNAGDNQLSLYAQGVITRGRVFHPGDAAVLTAQELKQLDDAVGAAKSIFRNAEDRRDAYERLMVLVDYLGEQMMERGEQADVQQSESDALLPGAEFYQQYINEHFEGHSESAIIKLSNALVQITDEYTKMPDWYQRESILAQMRVQANRNLRANGFGGAKDIVELMMNHVMPQDQQRDLAKMRVYSAGQYGGTVMGEELRTIAHQVKEYGTDSSVRAVVDKMIGIFNNIPDEDMKKMILIPMPGASGYPGYMEKVVNELGERTGLQTANSLFSTEHEPLYDLKKNGTAYEQLPDIKFEMDGTLPAGTIVVLVDNVLDTGKTLSQASKADFGEGVEVRAAVLAHTDNYQEYNPQIEVRTIPQLREELSVLRDQRKAEREAGYEAAIAALEVSQQGVDAAAVEEMKRLLTISWKSPFGGKDAKEQLNALGVDWKTGETIVANAADRVSFQYVPKNYVSTISDAEKSMMSQVASDLMTGNHLLGRRRPDGYRELMAEIGGAFAAVKTLSVTPRQRDLLVALSGQYHEGIAELASQSGVSEDVFTEALRRVDAERPAVVQDVAVQPYQIYHEGDTFVVDYHHGFGLADNLVQQVAGVHDGQTFERAGRTMVLFDNERSMRGFIDNIRILNITYTNNLRDAMIERLRGAGIQVNDNIVDGQRILDEANGRVSKQIVDDIRKEDISFFRAGDKQAYGFVDRSTGTFYVDLNIARADWPLHEYTHLWAAVLRQQNQKEWANIVQMMKDTPNIWNYVKEQYPDLHSDDDIADECLAHFSGQRGFERLTQYVDGKNAPEDILDKVAAFLGKFWKAVADLLHIHFTTKEDVADFILNDFLNERNPLDYLHGEKLKDNMGLGFQFIGEKGATNLDVALDGGMYISNLRHAEKLEKIGRSPLDIKIETGWERGADGQWRLELPSFNKFDAAANLEWLQRHPDTVRYLELLSKENAHLFGGFAPLTSEERAEYERLRELPDNKYWTPGVTKKNPDRLTLEDYVSSPLLFMAYPELRHVAIRVEEMEDRGAYATRKSIVDGSVIHYIRLNKDMVEGCKGMNVGNRRQMESTINHEVQHYIQEQEGFARGTDVRRINGASEFELNIAAWDGFVQQEVGQVPTYEQVMSYLKDEQHRDWRKEFGPGYQDMMKDLVRMSGDMDKDTFMKNYEYYRDNGLKGEAWTQYWQSMGEVESRNVQARMGMSMEQRRHTLAINTEDVPRDLQTANYTSVIAASRDVPEQPVQPRKFTPADREAGGAMVDHLQAMGITVHTDSRENRRILKAAEKDQSEAGKIRHFKTEQGESYGFAYKGEIHLDLRKLDAELPLHEYAHLFCQAMQRVNPDNWNHVVGMLKQDTETWNAVKRIYPELTSDNDIAEEAIAQFSGKRGAEKLQAELERMTPRDADYGSRWGNIYQNVAKAIQDFWKHIGDSMNIEYSSKEDIADQILNDFAKNVNPVRKMERWLEERDKEYAAAVEVATRTGNADDWSKAHAIFVSALQENVGNGVTPIMAVDGYRGKLDRLARDIKDVNNTEAIKKAVDLMAPRIPANAVLVPAPSHLGYATDTLVLAQALSERTDVPVADILKSDPRERQYDVKKATGHPLTAEQLGIRKEGELPEGKMPFIIDNVVNSGNTAEACVKALGHGIVYSLASATSQERHAATLKSAETAVYDKQGQLIPLSERFELKNKWLGRVMNYKPLDGAVQQPVVKEPDVIQGLEGYSVEDVKSFVENSIDEILEDAGLSDDITIKNITVVGSRSRGEAHEGSDLDILVEYEGDFREDALFDILHEEALDLEGITIDINPINPHYSLTTEQWLARDAQWREEDRQKAVAKSGMNENVQSKNIRSMQTSVIKSNLQVLADRLLPGTQSRVRFMKPQDPDRPSAVGGEIYRREDGIHVFRENQDVPLSSIDDRNELTDLYRSLLEYSIAERIGNGNGMNFPDSPNIDGYEISVAAVVDGNLRVMGTRDGDQANNSSYITMEGLEELIGIIDKRVAEVENIRDFDAVALHESNYQAFALAASALKSKVTEPNTLYDNIIAIGDMPPTVEHLEEWASEQMDLLRRGDADSVRVNELSNGKYRKFLSAVSAYLPEEDVKRLIDGIAAQRNTYSENHIIDQYDKVISHYQVHAPEGALADDVVSLLAAKDGVALMNWVRDSHTHDHSEPLQQLKAMLSTKTVYQADQITAAIQERDLQVDHRAQVERSLPKTPIEQSYAFVMGYYINNVSKMSEDEKALFKRLDSAHSVDAYQRWASDVRVGGALQGLSDMPEAIRADVLALANQIIETKDDVLKDEVIDALDGIGIVNQFRKDALAQQYDALKAQYPDETILFRNGQGFSVYGADVNTIQDQTGWLGQTVGDKGQQFRWLNLNHDGYNVLSDKELNLRVVTPAISIRPLASQWKDEMGAALQTIDYSLSLGDEKPVLIDTDGSLVISDKDSDFKVKTLDFHSTGLTAISEEGKEMVIRDIPKNYYHPQGTLVVADYINGHRQTIEHSLEASRPVSAEIQAKQTQLLASYKDVKAAHENEAVLFRQKGFFEAFGQDADRVAEKFGVPVYERNIGGKDVHFVMIPTEKYASALEDGVDLDLFVAKAQVDENRRDIRSTISLNEQIAVEYGRAKLGVSVTPIDNEGRYQIEVFNPDTKLAYDEPMELSKEDAEKFRSLEGMEHLSERSDLVMALADKYFSKELEMSDARSQVTKTYDNMGMSYTPLMLLQTIDFKPNQTAEVEHYNAVSVDPPYIMLYETMGDAEKSMSPRMLTDLPLDLQQSVLEQLKGGMFSEMQQEVAEHFEQPQEQHINIDDQLEHVGQLTKELGLEYVPFSIRLPITVPADKEVDWREEDKVFTEVMCNGDNVTIYQNHQDSYDDNNGVDLYDLPKDLQKEILDLMEEKLTDADRQMTVYVDTARVPEYAVGAIVNGDNTGLTDESIEMVREFTSQYPNHIFNVRDNSTSFNSSPAFGKATDCVDVDIVRIATPKQLRQEVLDKQTEKLQQRFNDFVKEHGEEPLYAEVTIRFKDDNVQEVAMIKLSEEVDPVTDDKIFFNVDNFEGLKDLLKVDNGEDFDVLDIEDTQFYAKSLYQTQDKYIAFGQEVPQETIDELKADGVTDFSTENLEKLLHFEAQDNDVPTNDVNFDELPYHISYGDDPTGVIEGDVHVQFTKELAYVSFEDFKHYAEDLGGSVRMMNNERWADFFRQDDAEKFANTVVDVNVSRMEAARAGAKDQVKSEIMNLLPNSGIDFVMNRGSELVIPFGDNKEAYISDVFCKDDIQLTGFVVDNTNMEKSPIRSFDELSAPVQLALFNEIKKTLSQIEVKKDDVLAEVTEKISQTENKEYSPDDVAILKEAAIAHIEKYNSDYYQAKGVDIKGMIEGSEVTDRHSLSAAVASVVFDIHSEAIGRESGILERLLPNDMSRADETFMQSRDAGTAAEAILDLRQNNLKDALDAKVAEVNTTLTEYNRLSQAADPSFMLHSHVEKYALEQQSENEFALTDPVERKFATSWMGARELLAHLASLLQKMFEKFPELKPSHEDKVEESAEEHVDAEEQAHAEKSDGQKKTSKWDNLDYTKYVLPEGADVTHKRWKFIKPKEGEQYGKYHIMCDFKGKHYEREMYGNDIKAFFEKDETGQRTNRVTLDQLVAKYFGKQFAESMSIGSVQEAEHVLAEQKDAKDQAVADKEQQAQQQADKENQAAQREAAEEKKAAEEAAKKKAEEEKKAEKKEKVPTLILQSSLLVGALLAAKENGGVWLNKDGKAAPVLHQSGTPTVSAFNGLMMALHSDAHGYKSNDYTTFNAAKADGYHVKGGENGLPFNWYKWDKYVNRFNANEVIDKAAYDALAPEEKELYKVQRIKEERSIFNIDQTTMPEVKKDAYGFILEAQEKDSVYRSAEESAVQPVSLPKQFLELKEKHPDAILLMRDGNSYNLYGDDADKLAGLLGLEVKDHDPEGNEIKFAAFPHHALDINLPKMIRAGHRVAICDQIGDIRSSQRHGAADAIYNKAVALEDALVKLSGNTNKVMKEPFFDTAYDGKEDTLRFADRRYYRPGNEIVTALHRVNDSFRAAAAYTGGESRLNRVAYSTMLPGDTEKYDRLVSELAAGVLMSRAGLPATLSKESMALVPYWERELKESPKLMESVERDVNNAVEVLEKIKAGETVDYAAIRGEKAFDAVRPKLYTIANELATIPNADTKIVVVVKDQQNKSAAVILPAGASLEVNNEITGLNKNRFLIALRKQGFENVQFYNAGGALGLNQSNEFFADKTVEVAKLKQYDLQVVENIDLSEEIERSLKVDLEQVQVTFDDNMHAVLYVKPVDGESFTVYPEPSDVKLFFDNVRSPEFDSIRENLGQKYYGLVARHPDLKTDVLMPKVSADLDLSRISKVNITKDRYKPESTIIFATIDGQQQKPIELSQIEAQRYWLVDDKNLYKLLVAAQKFEEQLHVDNGQSEGGQGQFHDSHEGSGVDSSSPSAEVSAEEDKQERKGGIRM